MMLQRFGMRLRFLVPVAALLVTSGCFATRSDVRVVQGDIASLRTELLRNDAELRDAVTQAMRLIAVANDSVRVLSDRTVSLQGDVRGETRSIRQQLLEIQTLLGQSQAALNRWRTEMELRAQTPPPVATAPPGTVAPPDSGDSTATVTAPPSLPPTTLYTSAGDQYRRGSWAAARSLFQELLTNYPTSEHAPEAQYYIAMAYEREKNLDAADAAFAAVVSIYPDSPRAPTALYKRANIAKQQGNNARAREFANEVLNRYPRSDEALLVPEFLKTVGG